MTKADNLRPRRSCLYMPGANPRALEKAKSLAADMLILDLEDAVLPYAKEEARDVVLSAVKEDAYGSREVVIRINSLDSPWGKEDITMAASSGADGILAPKVQSGTEVVALDQALTDAGAPPELSLWAMIEMPLAILNIQEIAAASLHTRLKGFVMGTNDLAKEYNAIPTADRLAFQVPLGLALAAARSYGLVAIDGVYNDIKDHQGLIEESEQGRILGFDGKTVIHPDQLEITNRIFSPSTDELAQAKAIIDAFSLPENQGRGVIRVNGKMTEVLHLEQAQRLVTIDNLINDKA